MRYATVLAALVGCASVDDPPGLSVPGMYVEFDTAVRVYAPEYQMNFSSIGVHLPEHLLVNSGQVELLGTDDACIESRIGIGVYPAVSADAGMQGKEVHSDAMPGLSGPAVVKVHVTYEVDYECPGTQTLSGTTDFTMFPGGRIVREDIMVAPSSTTLGQEGHCGCQETTANFAKLFFTSFWAFAPARATQVNPDGTLVTEGAHSACTMYPERAIGVAWQDLSGTNVRYKPHAAASHILDWVADATTLPATPKSITSAIQISNTALPLEDCAKVLALLADVPLQIGGTMLESTDHDGIYRDSATHPSPFTITPRDVAVPAGFVVSVDLGGATHARIVRSPAKEQVAIVQRESESSSRFFIAFVDGLAPGESLTIEPRR